ncbi:MAG: DUF4097 domain-containing protein [Treponema sp.]|nr:DUF4097 domain-containing protein [Treponema sp.]
MEDNITAAGTGLEDDSKNDPTVVKKMEQAKQKSAMFTSIAVMMYILSILPLIVFSSRSGLPVMFIMIAAATGLLIYNSMTKPKYTKSKNTKVEESCERQSGEKDLKKMRSAISSALWSLIVAAYFVVSFITFAWHITWVIFIIGAAIESLITLLMTMKSKHENEKSIENKVKVVTIIFSIITVLVLTGLVVLFVTGSIFGSGMGRWGRSWSGMNINIQTITGSFEIDGEYSVADPNVDSININWVAGEIRIVPHNGYDIRITESAQRELRDNERLQFDVSGNTLTIRFTERNIANRVPRKNLEILVPQALSENMNILNINTVSGEVIVTDINANRLNGNGTSARINVLGTFNVVDLVSISGAITLNNLAENSRVDVDTVSGSVNLTGSFANVNVNKISGATEIQNTIVPSSLEINGVSGRVTIRIPADETITVNHSSVSGRLNSEVPIMTQNRGAQFNISTVSGRTNILPLHP